MDSGIQMFTTDSVSTISSGKIVAQTSTFEQTSMTDDDPGIRIIGDNKVELVYKNRVTNEEASIDYYNSNNSSNNAKLYIDNPRGTTSLIIDQNRRLGVGNIVPEAILHLHNHNNSNSEHIRVTNNDNLGMNMILTSSTTDIKANFGIRWYNSGSTTLVNNALVIRNLNGTNTIGIGTSTPSYTLDVSGNINFTGTLTQNGSTYTGSYTLPIASSSTLGGIKIGNNLSINGSGVVSATDTNTTYNVGDGGLTQNNFTNTLKTKLDGIATSANNYSLPAATSSSLGGIKVGTNLSIDSGTGVLSATDTNTTYSVGDGGLTQNNFTNTLKTKLDGIATSANNYTLPTAASDTLGGVKVGTNLSISSGVLSATDTNTTYSVGDGGLTQNNFTDALKTKLDGIATSANNYSLPTSSTSTLGGVKVDGSTITINGSGVISSSGGYTLPTAASDTLGGVKVGTNLSIDGNGVLSATNTTYSVGDGGLTQNNFTNTLKTKLDGIATSADVTNENNAATATKLSTARTIAGQSFDGSANIAIASTNLSDASTFTAPKSTILATARTIAGQSFDGSANIAIASTNLSDASTFTAPKSTILATARTIAGQSFDGSANIAIALSDLSNVHTTAPSSNQVLTWDGTNSRWAPADSSGGGSYTLPAATSSSLGGIKVGSGLDIDDSTSVLSVNTTTMDGQTLETLVGVCDGRSVTVESGTYTLPNVTSSQFTTTSWVDITGSSISYNPPTGTKQVLFEFNFSVDPDHDSGNTSYDTRFIFMIQMLIDGTAVTSQYLGVGDNQHNWGENYTFIGIIDITGTDSVSDGKLSSWSSTKTIKLQVAAYDNNYRHRMHSIRYGGFPGSTSTTNTLSKPKMKIQAIGQKTVFTLV